MRGAGVLLLGCVLLAAELPAQPAPPGEPPESAQPAPARDPVLDPVILPGPAPGATPERPAPPESRVYGVEVESTALRDRLLVFADGPVRPRVQEVDPGTVMLVFPGSTLDPSAPRSAQVPADGVLENVSVFEPAGRDAEVRITILRTPGAAPRLSVRGGQVALDFARPRRARAEQASPERTLPARWLNIDIRQAVERLARFVDMRLIFDERLRGNVSIDAVEPLSESEAATMIEALLLLKGFAAVDSPGDARKILPLAQAPGAWVETLEANPDETPLVTLVRLQDIDAGLVRQAVQPLVGQQGIVEVHERTNALLLAGPGNRLRRVVDVMKTLDESGMRRLVLIPLRHADAEVMADMLLSAIDDKGSQLEVWPDARTNRLVVRGRPSAVERAREYVARIDRPFDGKGNLQVIAVRYMNADQLAETLRGLASQDVISAVRGAASLAGRQFAVSVHGPTRSLVVQAAPETIDIVRDVVAELDVPPARVEVEVTIAEVNLLSSMSLSFDSIIPLVEPDGIDDLIAVVVTDPGGNAFATSSTAGGLFTRVAQTPIVIPILDGGGNPVIDPTTGNPLTAQIPRATGVVTAEEFHASSRLLQKPRLSMVSGEQHEIFAGENIPVPVARADATNPLEVSQTIERRDTGVRLRVEPIVPKTGPLQLGLDIEVSAFGANTAAGPTFLERSLQTTVSLQSGHTAVVGWARLPANTDAEVGVPWLSKLPIIGVFFRSTVELELSTTLLIAVRAERIEPLAEQITDWMRRELDAGGRPETASVP